MFQNVIVRRPCRALVEGITSNPQLGKPDYEKACQQHDTYIEALKQCGVAVTVLEADERYPDSCFVEDPAVITHKCAIITNPGAPSRNGERTRSSAQSVSSSRRIKSSISKPPVLWRAAM